MLRVNVKKTRMTISGNARKVPAEGRFPCAVCRKADVGSDSIQHFHPALQVLDTSEM